MRSCQRVSPKRQLHKKAAHSEQDEARYSVVCKEDALVYGASPTPSAKSSLSMCQPPKSLTLVRQKGEQEISSWSADRRPGSQVPLLHSFCLDVMWSHVATSATKFKFVWKIMSHFLGFYFFNPSWVLAELCGADFSTIVTSPTRLV